MNELKQCTKCKKEKEIICFGKNKQGKNGLSPRCKECLYPNEKTKQYQKEYRLQNKEKNSVYKKEYRKKNLEKLVEKAKIVRETESYKEYMKKFRTDNKDALVEYSKRYYEENKVKILAKYKERDKTENSKTKRRTYIKNKRKNDICFKISDNIRGRIYKSLKRNSKSKKTLELIGCTIEELKFYIEGKFKDGMTWENYSYDVWHIDHIRPCASFDLSDPEQQKICFHYTNMQPLWAEDNLKKGGKYDLYLV